ncbi:hypothetical protein [Arthrobacter woluwensis]|uniref:Uncharacterized protein n=1 Tax=Arthrobacter woluwensis TaxID=156980 RepID=A0A1H4KI72_9MICC|nr:hypothetical protein [Arthrobacter woluwensis]SEB58244.1 hypothetical protein SAMN04489745_0661 [Arthrobacter woluwensis]
MQTIPERQRRVFRISLLCLSIAAGLVLGGFVGLLLGLNRQSSNAASPVLFGLSAAFSTVIMAVLIPLMASEERRLQRRLDDCGTAASTGPGSTAWPAVPAVLVRVMPARRRAPFTTALFTANTPERGVLPVAVRLPVTASPQPSSGAWLRLSPADPAVAVIDPFATPDDHANAGSDPALARLSRVQRGLAVPAGAWVGPVLIGIAVAAIMAALTALLAR